MVDQANSSTTLLFEEVHLSESELIKRQGQHNPRLLETNSKPHHHNEEPHPCHATPRHARKSMMKQWTLSSYDISVYLVTVICPEEDYSIAVEMLASDENLMRKFRLKLKKLYLLT